MTGHSVRKILNDQCDALKESGYKARTWMKTNDDALATVKLSQNRRRDVLLARVYLEFDGDNVGYVELHQSGVPIYDHVAYSHRDEVKSVLS
jgi:hypothetical protein